MNLNLSLRFALRLRLSGELRQRVGDDDGYRYSSPSLRGNLNFGSGMAVRTRTMQWGWAWWGCVIFL